MHIDRALPFLLIVAALAGTGWAQGRLPFGAGDRFPEVVLPDVDGGFSSLAAYRGQKVIVLNFASW